MNKEEMLDQLDDSREQILVLLEPLTDEALVKSGVLGKWSIADILVHLTTWESEVVTALLQIDRGKEPQRLLNALANTDSYNAQRFAENVDRDLDRIFADWHDVRLQLEDWLESFSERELNDPKRFHWANNKSLGQIIRENTWVHEAEHLPEIASFLAEWQAEQQD